MSYAAVSDVLARAGRFAGAFQREGTHPDTADVASVLDDVAAEMDAAIRSVGYDPAGISDSVKAAMVNANAFGALAILLPAAVPGQEAADLVKYADTMYTDAVAAMVAGTFPAFAELFAGEGGEGVTAPASDFWTDSGYTGEIIPPWIPVTPWDAIGRRRRYGFNDPNLGPSVVKGQPL